MLIIKKLFVFVLLMATLFTCAKQKKSDNLIHLGLSDDPPKWDPALNGDEISNQVLSQVYEAPYQYHYLKTQFVVVPNLASELPIVTNNGLSVLIRFLPGVLYHDSHPALKGKGRTVQARDFELAIKRMAFVTSSSPGFFVIDGRIKGIEKWQKEVGSNFEKMLKTPIEGVILPDGPEGLTLQLELTKAYPALGQVMSLIFFSPIPYETLDPTNPFLTSDDDVGTGPYEISKQVAGLEIVLKKFNKYREVKFPEQSEADGEFLGSTFASSAGKKLPLNDGIHFHVFKQDQASWLQFLKGNIIGAGIPKDYLSAVLDDNNQLKPEYAKQNFQLKLVTTLSQWWIGLNMRHPLIGKNKDLREALAYSLDKKDFIQKFSHGMQIPAKGIMPVSILKTLGSDMPEISFDLNKAKEALAKAGYPAGKGLQSFNFDIRSLSTEARQQAEWFQMQWKKIGIDIKIVANSFGAYIEKAKKESLEIYLDGWGLDYPSADNVTQLLYSKNFPPGSNVSYYHSAEVDQWHESLCAQSDPDKAHELIVKITNKVYEDLPWIPLFTSRGFLLLSDKVNNYRPGSMFTNRLKYWEMKN